MHTSSNGRQLIESFEGCFLQAYDDSDDKVLKSGDTCKGTITIGFGHTTAAGNPRVFIGQSITRDQADSILASDLAAVEKQVTSLVKVGLNQNEFDALVSFQFNTGALGRSSILKYLNNGDRQKAADAFLLYTKASKISASPIPGLVRRRQAERTLFLKDPGSLASSHTTAGTVIAAGGAAAVAQPHHAWWIIPVAIGVGLLVWFAISYFRKGNK